MAVPELTNMVHALESALEDDHFNERARVQFKGRSQSDKLSTTITESGECFVEINVC